MNRKEAIQKIMQTIDKKDIVIVSTGMTARAVYEVKDRALNFYMLGSMGNALAIGLGLALNTDRKVIVINGDASVLMSLGTIATQLKLKPKNLYHYILDNHEHGSTGGQPSASKEISFQGIPNTEIFEITKGKDKSPRIPLSCKTLKERFMKALHE